MHDIDSEKQRFKDHYRGAILDEFAEDYILFRSLKRTVNSYCKTPDKNKIHAIYNKIIILRRVYCDEFIFPEIIKIGDADLYKTSFLKYIMNEVFCSRFKIIEFDEQWEDDLLTLQVEKKITKQPRRIQHTEAHVYLCHLKKFPL